MERIVIKDGASLRVIETGEIQWIEAAANYVFIHASGGAHRLRSTMEEMSAGLDPERFIRVHRSRIVNVEKVREVAPAHAGRCAVVLADGTRLMASRQGRQRLISALKGGDEGASPPPEAEPERP